jgi:peptide/nickel transport system permease protein
LLAGFLGKFVDEVLMRFTDMMLVIPGLPLLIVLVAVLGPNIWNVIVIIGFLGWMGFARIVRSQVLTIRERPFVEAARASGAGPGRIIVKHVFPNIVSLTYVNLALSVPAAILTEAALAFLGLSDPSIVSWGHMFENINISGDLAHFPPAWWWVLPPGFGIALVSLSFILIGYALDEIFNPRLRKRR